MTFGSMVAGPGVLPNVFGKVDAPPQYTKNFSWRSLPESLQRIKECFSGRDAEGALLIASRPDFYWEDLANPCALD